jgi:thiol-disulfide isomerase/thioredoxin
MHNAALLLILSLACLCQAARAANLDEALVGEAVALDDGGTVRLADYIGNKPMYIKFWASWCVPCREQMPHLERTWREFGDDMEIVSVNIWVNETESAIAATREEFGLTVPIAIDERGRLAKAFDFFGTPWHVLIDTDGNIVHTGHEADADVDRKIGLLAARQSGKLPAIDSRKA